MDDLGFFITQRFSTTAGGFIQRSAIAVPQSSRIPFHKQFAPIFRGETHLPFSLPLLSFKPSRRRSENLGDAAMSPPGRPCERRGPWLVVRQGLSPRHGPAEARPYPAGRGGQPTRAGSNGNPRPSRRSSPRRRARWSRIGHDAAGVGRGCHASKGRAGASSAASLGRSGSIPLSSSNRSMSGSLNKVRTAVVDHGRHPCAGVQQPD